MVQDIGKRSAPGVLSRKWDWMARGRSQSGSSYFFFTAEPGEHHLLRKLAILDRIQIASLRHGQLHRRTGRSLLLPLRVIFTRQITYSTRPLNSDQGKFLVASSAFSVSHPKK